MSGLLDVGAQCSHSSCNQVDFLPIFCLCQKYFCRDHVLPDAHSCPKSSDHQPVQPTQPAEKRRRCAADKCGKPSIDSYNAVGSASCTYCHISYCVYHRHPKSHSCSGSDNSSPVKNEKARALLAKNFASTSSTIAKPRTTPKIPSDPAKLAQYQKLELIKMRHKASPCDPKDNSPLERRLHFRISTPDGIEKIFWVRKGMVTGRVLDLVSAQLKLSSSSQLQLRKTESVGSDAIIPIQYDKQIETQVEDGSFLVLSPQDR